MSGVDGSSLGVAEGYALEPDEGAAAEVAEHRAELREHYGRVRGYFRRNSGRYADVQRSLRQARFDVRYDVYLARSLRLAVLGALLGLVLGGLGALLFAHYGVFASLSSPVAVSGPTATWIGGNRVILGGVVLAGLGTATGGATAWWLRVRYPAFVAAQRRRAIDVTLPHAIVFLYAHSHGGMNLFETVRELAAAEDTYGPVAEEFDSVVRDVELFGNDLYTAIRNQRNLTPSERLEQFLDDLLGVLDAGGDATEFFEAEADSYLDEAESEQESFLETLSLLSEVFVVGFVAAPLFIIVLLLVMSLLGASTLVQLALVVYLMVPLGMLAYLVLIDTLSEPYKQQRVVLDAPQADRDPAPVTARSVAAALVESVRIAARNAGSTLQVAIGGETAPTSAAGADNRTADFRRYRHRRSRRALRAALANPFETVRRNPDRSLAVTVPLALLAVAAIVATGVATPTVDGLLAAPVATTVWLFVLPLLVVSVPLSYLHERRRAREASIGRRFPDTLGVLASANRMGIRFVDALGLIARWTRGPLARQLRVTRNDVRWNHDTTGALLRFGNRLRTPQLSRTVRLVAGGLRSSGDLARVLSVAADDTRSRYRMERARRQELSTYTAVVVIGFLVYLLVLVLLSVHYLEPVAAAATPAEIDGIEVPFSLGGADLSVYTAVLFHSTLLQALGSGLLAGKLVNNSLRSGLKYSVALILLSVLAFALI